MADSTTKRILNAVLGLNVIYTIYPVMAAATIAGTVVTSGASAFGATKELIAVNVITTEYWVCAADFDTPQTAQAWRIEIGTGAAGVFTTSRMQVQLDQPIVTAVGTYAMNARCLIGPFPAWVAANTQLVARATGTAAKTIGVSTTIATGL